MWQPLKTDDIYYATYGPALPRVLSVAFVAWVWDSTRDFPMFLIEEKATKRTSNLT